MFRLQEKRLGRIHTLGRNPGDPSPGGLGLRPLPGLELPGGSTPEEARLFSSPHPTSPIPAPA